MKDVHSWVQPLRIAALRLIKLLNLLLKHGENAARRIEGLEPVNERVLKRSSFVHFLYVFKALSKISWKLDDVEEE
jgi:hypothetical protein